MPVVMALIIAACGSTVPAAQQEAAEEAAAEGLEVPGGGAGAGGLGGGDLDGGGVPGGTTGGGGTVVGDGSSGTAGTAAGGGAAGSGGSGAVASDANGPGITADKIVLGLQTVTQAGEGNEALGAAAAGEFNYRRGWEALVEYQNEHGGITGRRISPVYHNFDALSNQSFAQQEQEACQDWTQDHQVFAVLTVPFSTNIMKCTQDAGAVLNSIEGVSSISITPTHQKFPVYIAPIALALDRVGSVMVERLKAMRYFSRDQKLGLVTFDHPNFRYAAERGLMPALERHGLELTDSAFIHYRGGHSDYPQMSNEISNAALRFKAAGIDHVVFIDLGGNLAFFFMQAAERQDYRPRYGLSTLSGNQVLVDLLGNDAKPQLTGARSIGWSPWSDVRPEDDPDTKNQTRILCFAIMRKAGVDTSSPNGKLGALAICDGLWSLGVSLRDSRVVNQSTFLTGMNHLRGSYSPGSVWSTFIDSSRHNGVAAVADMAFNGSCSCFKYISKPNRI